MPVIEPGQESAFVIAERRLNFKQFVMEQKAKGSPGMPKAVLHSHGHRDFYGPVVFEPGITRKGQWVLRDGANPTVLVYKNRDEAQNYANSLLPILREVGYFGSKVKVEKISIHYSFGHPISPLLDPTEFWEDDHRYIIRLKVQEHAKHRRLPSGGRRFFG